MPPYNTRRKSLSLSELGIAVPKRSRVTEHPSPPETVVEGEEPPVKRSKRSHGSLSPPFGAVSPPRTAAIRLKGGEAPKKMTELSPPPSPAPATNNKIDPEGINDDIVVATIEQLEKTGNRPHLVKELAAILGTNLHAVEKYDGRSKKTHTTTVANTISRSANPSALISSRLTTYLNRSWPAISPCPLAKDLSPVHPRRLYFFLTTMPRQPIPDTIEPPKVTRIISPSLSSTSAIDEEDRYVRDRPAMSPSPEVDLFSPELDENSDQTPPTPGSRFHARNSAPRERPEYSHPRRAASPPLEHEERDFKQTASQLHEQAQARRNSQNDIKMEMDTDSNVPNPQPDVVSTSIEVTESDENAVRHNSEAAMALFGSSDHLTMPQSSHMDFSSPLLPPRDGVQVHSHPVDHTSHTSRLHHEESAMDPMSLDVPDVSFSWDNLQSPETVELDELEHMFDAY